MSANETEVSALDPDEPHTPWWMPLLGLGLFLIAGIFLLATGGEDENPEGASAPPVAEGKTDPPAEAAE